MFRQDTGITVMSRPPQARRRQEPTTRRTTLRDADGIDAPTEPMFDAPWSSAQTLVTSAPGIASEADPVLSDLFQVSELDGYWIEFLSETSSTLDALEWFDAVPTEPSIIPSPLPTLA